MLFYNVALSPLSNDPSLKMGSLSDSLMPTECNKSDCFIILKLDYVRKGHAASICLVSGFSHWEPSGCAVRSPSHMERPDGGHNGLSRAPNRRAASTTSPVTGPSCMFQPNKASRDRTPPRRHVEQKRHPAEPSRPTEWWLGVQKWLFSVAPFWGGLSQSSR